MNGPGVDRRAKKSIFNPDIIPANLLSKNTMKDMEGLDEEADGSDETPKKDSKEADEVIDGESPMNGEG